MRAFNARSARNAVRRHDARNSDDLETEPCRPAVETRVPRPHLWDGGAGGSHAVGSRGEAERLVNGGGRWYQETQAAASP